MLSVTTDYATSTGDPSPYLKRIADAGFTHTHWCHQWNTDFLYSKWEIDQIRTWLDEYGVQLLDLHGSAGKEKDWTSLQEYQRLAGVELVRNRIEMTADLGADVVIMHIPGEPNYEPVRRSLDALEAFSRERGVRIAIENGGFAAIAPVLAHYSPDYVGLCYDCGHGNMVPDGLDQLEFLKDRLISVHLHDNNGTGDQHQLMFMGTVDWQRLADIMARSSYTKCVSMEVSMRNSGVEDEAEFLKIAYDTGTEFAEMILKCGEAAD